MSAQIIDNLMEQIKSLRLQQQIDIGETVGKLTNEIKSMETQQRQYVDAHNRQAQTIADLRANLIMYRHLTSKSQECIEQLVQRVRNRTPDDMSSFPGDRAALLDADMVLSQIYKTFQAEQA